MARSYTNLLYHVVFSTKDRHPWLDAAIAERLYEYIGGGVRDEGGIALAINGMPDHIHLLVKLRQDKAVSDVLRSLKANSSHWIHETFPACGDFAWQNGYGAFTVSQSQVPRVEGYVAGQARHHRRRSFKEEFIALLKAHGVEFDEKYLWD